MKLNSQNFTVPMSNRFNDSIVQLLARSNFSLFKCIQFAVLIFIILKASFANGQDHQLMFNSTWTPTTTNFLQSFPFPALPSAATKHLVGKGYNAIDTRAIFYGGNLGVAQHISDYGLAGGKWSFVGGWQRSFTTGGGIPPSSYISPGVDYLVNYHRWGNYSTHFGLRASIYDLIAWEEGTSPPDLTPKDAVITWAYEAGAAVIPNRLVFQSIVGVHHPTGGAVNHVAKEWATILSNGNIGSGTPTPTAQFQIKQLNADPSMPLAMEILDASSVSKLAFTKTGRLGIGLGNVLPSQVLDILGNVKILTNTPNVPGNLALDVAGNVKVVSNSTIPNNIVLDVIGNSKFSGYLSIENLIATNNPINITSNSTGTSRSLFAINDAGVVRLNQYGNGNNQSLKIDGTGNIFATATPYPDNSVWQVGGNTFTGTSIFELGSWSTNDVNMIAGGVTSFSLSGDPTTRGQMKIIKPVSMGGNTTTGYSLPNSDWALTLRPIATGTGQGSLRVLDQSGTSSSDEIMATYDTYVDFLHGSLKIFDTELQLLSTIYAKSSTVDLGGVSTTSSGIPAFRDIYYHSTVQLTSDRRIKENIKEINCGLKEVLLLNPVSYTNKFTKHNLLGFIAQEVFDVIPGIVGVPTNDSLAYSISILEMIPVLTKAIQEQNSIIDSLKHKLDLVFASNQMKEYKNISSQKEVLNQLPLLFQNHPNPFNGFTFIDYFLPIKASNAFLKVVDNNGKLIKSFPLNQTGLGQIELDCTGLAVGTFYYSLLVNFQVVDTKTMIIAADN